MVCDTTIVNYSAEHIIALAPDAASAKAGRSLATTSKWQNVGQNERALWGECQGSGAKPYQTVIDLNEPAFKCSCPSRKFPCKHALGLFLLIANQPEIGNNVTNVPDWAAEWLAKRDQQTQRRSEAATKADEEPDEATLARRASQKAKRSLDREGKVVAGLKELDLWLRDLVRHGLAAAQTRPFDYWEKMAARMIDAQAPGVARRVRDLARVPQSGEGWIEQLLARVSSLFLLLKAFERIETLPAATQADVRSAIGWSLKEDELPEDNLVSDQWLVLGQRTTGEEGLRVRRTWLWGRGAARGALVLDFAAPGQHLAPDLLTGTTIDAELIFYPSNYPLRAVIKNRIGATRSQSAIAGYPNSDELLMIYADVLARNPWLEAIPAPLQTMVPVRRSEQWFARDMNGRLLSLRGESDSGWKLLALSGGYPITIFGEWNGHSLLPVSAWNDGRHVEL
ncbi:MAG TPA: SWIM zinc finger family protein [Pyrinomonadaceae bacterium]|nr:SWIM zinc finger family protein [Pyrinomonadaceae bacterium]